jgi:hypothetical protein
VKQSDEMNVMWDESVSAQAKNQNSKIQKTENSEDRELRHNQVSEELLNTFSFKPVT